MKSNTKAVLMLRRRVYYENEDFADLVVWRVPSPVRGSLHVYKYRFAYVEAGRCEIRFDNEAGKGDHKHIGSLELPYAFVTVQRLLQDFFGAVAVRRARR